ncbi:MAG: primosomal protein N' [Firmicutes bacterium]|nr:primosomal protein N' [Bacillota bacterium]
MKFAEVIVDISNSEVDRIFDYATGGVSGVEAGARVTVPFGARIIEGYVIRLKETSLLDPKKIKPVCSVLDEQPLISAEMLALADFMVKKYLLRMADALRLFIPPHMRGGRIKTLKKLFAYLNPDYIGQNPDTFIKPSAAAQHEVFMHLAGSGEVSVTQLNQEFSASALRNLITRGIVLTRECAVQRKPYTDLVQNEKRVELTAQQNAAVQTILSGGADTYVLHGVTGSGKTEVYMACIADALQNGKTAIMLVPEIGLTPQVLKNFRSRFGEKVALLHSGLSAGERFDEWLRLKNGEASVAIGARSAVFAPLTDVGLIIIDEEHDASYNSDTNPRYNTAEVAAFRRAYNQCNLVLASATPSVETFYAAKMQQAKLISMSARVNKKPLPEIEIVDMCKELIAGNNSMFSRALETQLRACVEAGNQAVLFINRRGYSGYIICRSCGHVPKCLACDVSLVYHKEDDALKCHYCNARYALINLCPECNSPHIRQGYAGTQRVEETLKQMFPAHNILRMDNDTTQTKDAHARILEQFAQKKAAVLVGTQMVAKGHDFPDVTLVGILDADISLHFSDYRSVERTFQLITQAAGRAGREQKAGKVVLQTYTPRHYVFKYAAANDYAAFFEKECNLREVTKFPPFAKIVRILLGSESESAAADALKSIFEEMQALSKQYKNSFAYLAAMRSPVKKIQNKHRMQILARLTSHTDELITQIGAIAAKYKTPQIMCFIEQNPNNLS